jgi:hypothetical protein
MGHKRAGRRLSLAARVYTALPLVADRRDADYCAAYDGPPTPGRQMTLSDAYLYERIYPTLDDVLASIHVPPASVDAATRRHLARSPRAPWYWCLECGQLLRYAGSVWYCSQHVP